MIIVSRIIHVKVERKLNVTNKFKYQISCFVGHPVSSSITSISIFYSKKHLFCKRNFLQNQVRPFFNVKMIFKNQFNLDFFFILTRQGGVT